MTNRTLALGKFRQAVSLAVDAGQIGSRERTSRSRAFSSPAGRPRTCGPKRTRSTAPNITFQESRFIVGFSRLRVWRSSMGSVPGSRPVIPRAYRDDAGRQFKDPVAVDSWSNSKLVKEGP